jgi:TOBE domain
MEKKYYRLSWYIWILLVLTVSIHLRPPATYAEEQPAGHAPGSDQTPSVKPEGMSETFTGTVVEVIDAGRHIYVRVDSGQKQVWVAVPAFDGKPGDKVLVPPGVAVADFQSKKLNRTFKMIYFVGGIRRIGDNPADGPHE